MFCALMSSFNVIDLRPKTTLAQKCHGARPKMRNVSLQDSCILQQRLGTEKKLTACIDLYRLTVGVRSTKHNLCYLFINVGLLYIDN